MERDFDWIPAVELRQEGNNLIARADLPGVEHEDVKVEMTDDGLVISGEREQQSTSEERGMRRSEIVYGRFYRMIPLPDNAKADQAQANFDNGVLQITIPLSQEQETRKQIPISSGEQAKSAQTGQSAGQSRAASASSSSSSSS